MSTRDRVILLLLLVGFATFVLEIRYEHRYAVKEYWQAWIPIVYSAIACLACLIGLAGSKSTRTIAASIFFLGIPVSIVGLYMHTKFDPAMFEKFLFPERTVYSTMQSKNGEKAAVTISQPLAAPLGIMGLASVGFMLSSGLFKTGSRKSD